MNEKIKTDPILSLIDQVFERDILADFEKYYIRRHGINRKWFVASDYQFDKSAENAIITFSCLPYNEDLNQKLSRIRGTKQKEIKNTKKIQKQFLCLLRSEHVFSVSFILQKDKYLLWPKQIDAKKAILNVLASIEMQIKDWETRKTGDLHYYTTLKQKVKSAKIKVNQNKNIKEGMQMIMVTLLTAYVCARLTLMFECSVVGWFSDRDTINDVFGNFSKDLVNLYFNYLVEPSEPRFVVANATSASDNWYDELILLPDLITGALSTFDNTLNESKSAKHHILMTHVIANKYRNCYIMAIKNSNSGFEVNRKIYYLKGIRFRIIVFWETFNIYISCIFNRRKL